MLHVRPVSKQPTQIVILWRVRSFLGFAGALLCQTTEFIPFFKEDRDMPLGCPGSHFERWAWLIDLLFTREQPIDADPKLLLEMKQDVSSWCNQTAFIFRKLALADSELRCEILLASIESANFSDPTP
jgi:hypothetical protein